MDSLRKIDWPSLYQLSLCRQLFKEGVNKIREIRRLPELASKNLRVIAIELSKDIEQCHYINWIVKMETPSLNKLCTFEVNQISTVMKG